MSFFDRVNNFLDRHISVKRIIYVILFLIVVLLVMLTSSFWGAIISKLLSILKPFIIGFALAYLIRPIVLFFERYKIKRAISVPITLVLFIAILFFLFSSIIPSLVEDISQLITNSVDGLQQLFEYYKNLNPGESHSWSDDILKQVTGMLNGLISQLTTLPSLATDLVGKTLSVVTTAIFSFIIGMYFIFDYEKFSSSVLHIANNISPRLKNAIIVVDGAVSRYLKTLVVIMTITCIEYSLLYFIIGHNYALVLGVLTAIGLLIPYIGPTIIHVLGILTALTLPLPRVIILTIGLIVLSNVDGYVISPMVYSKRDKIEPLWSLFTFFASSVLFGFVGILISMPLYFSIRAVLELYHNNWVLPEEN